MVPIHPLRSGCCQNLWPRFIWELAGTRLAITLRAAPVTCTQLSMSSCSNTPVGLKR
jgi:hypothetical protein